MTQFSTFYPWTVDTNFERVANQRAASDARTLLGLIGATDMGAKDGALAELLRVANQLSGTVLVPPPNGLDDSAAIQATFDACPPGGRVVFPAVPLTTPYIVGTQVAVTNPCTVEGFGYPMVRARTGFTLTQLFYIEDVDDVTFKGVAFDGRGTAANIISFAAAARNPRNHTVEGCRFTGTKDDNPLTLLTACVRTFSTGGIDSGFRCKNFQVFNNRFESIGSYAWLCAYTDVVRGTGNFIKDAPFTHGAGHVSCTRIQTRGNWAENCALSGFEIGAASSFFEIADNDVLNCGGDGSISVEQTSTYGTIATNRCIDCNSPGINVSFGASDLVVSPNNETLKSISVTGNTVRAKVGIATTVPGINVYSSTSPYIGQGLDVSDNDVEGFAIPVSLQFAANSRVSANRIAGTTLTCLVRCTLVTDSEISRNSTGGTTSGAAVQFVSYSGNHCTRNLVDGNSVFLAGAAADQDVVSIEGTGDFRVTNSRTAGAAHYVTCSGNAVLSMAGNLGALTVGAIGGTGVPVILHAAQNWTTLTTIVNGLQILAGRKTGWGAPTGTPDRNSFDVSTVTLAQLAARVAALLNDLNQSTGGHGLIGT